MCVTDGKPHIASLWFHPRSMLRAMLAGYYQGGGCSKICKILQWKSAMKLCELLPSPCMHGAPSVGKDTSNVVDYSDCSGAQR